MNPVAFSIPWYVELWIMVIVYIPVTSLGTRDNRTARVNGDWRGATLEAEVDRLGDHTQAQADHD